MLSPTGWLTSQECSIPGESSFDRHADLASRIPQLPTLDAIEHSPIANEVRNLRSMINHRMPRNTTPACALNMTDFHRQLLPVELVIKLVRIMKSRRPAQPSTIIHVAILTPLT